MESKHGWPLGKHEHRLGTTWASMAPALAGQLLRRYKVEVVAVPLATDGRLVELVTVPTRLGMERYGVLRAFISGYNAGAGGY